MKIFNETQNVRSPLTDFLVQMKGRLADINHVTQSDNTLYYCRNISRIIIARYVNDNHLSWDDYFVVDDLGKHLKVAAEKLECYDFNGSDEKKANVINEFKNEFVNDIDLLIYSLRNNIAE